MKSKTKVSIFGKGFVGNACYEGFKDIADIKVYDKYKNLDSFLDTINHSDIIFLCLPTPMNLDGSCNTSILEESIKNIEILLSYQDGKGVYSNKVFVIKSTVPPGTTQKLQERYPEHTFIFNPEFLREATAIKDFQTQDRIVLGCPMDPELGGFHRYHENNIQKLVKFYEEFTDWQTDSFDTCGVIWHCASQEAEMTKYVTNCFLATKLSFFNEIYKICEALKIDYDKMMSVVLLDERVGKGHTKVPGPDGQFGWSLSCLPKDINALRALCLKIGVNTLILDSVWEKNLQVREKHDWDLLPQVNGRYINE